MNCVLVALCLYTWLEGRPCKAEDSWLSEASSPALCLISLGLSSVLGTGMLFLVRSQEMFAE